MSNEVTDATQPETDSDKRVHLTFEQAEAMLPLGKFVHTFANPHGMLVGTDWERAEVLAHIRKHGAELAGDMATRMGHGIVVLEAGGDALFIATRQP